MTYATAQTCIGVDKEGQMIFVGPANDYRHAIVARIVESFKSGKMPTETDLAEIADLPVLHESEVEEAAITVEFRRK